MEQSTETVEVRIFSTDAEKNLAIQDKLEAIYAEIVATAPVAKAFDRYEAGSQDVSKLKKARTNLTQRGADLFRMIAGARSQLELTTVESYAEGTPLLRTSESLEQLVTLEREQRLISQVISRIVEHLLPNAEIIETRRAADYFAAKGNALREAALERIQKTAQLMVEAAQYEGSIVFDSQNTLSGELRRHAEVFDDRARRFREAARDSEARQMKLTHELASLNTFR